MDVFPFVGIVKRLIFAAYLVSKTDQCYEEEFYDIIIVGFCVGRNESANASFPFGRRGRHFPLGDSGR